MRFVYLDNYCVASMKQATASAIASAITGLFSASRGLFWKVTSKAITFAPAGDGTAITYVAEFTMKGILRYTEPFLKGSFNKLADTYLEATRGLIAGGADFLMIETIFDTLNAKAAILAIIRACSSRRCRRLSRSAGP